MLSPEVRDASESFKTAPVFPPRARDIIHTAVADLGVPLPVLIGPCRCRRSAHPRQEVWRRLREVTGPDGKAAYSLPRIGRWFGGRDHTTILHGVRVATERQAGGIE
jgi:chromosomal replication initiator protein